MEDQALIESALRGDRAAFESLIVQHQSAVYGYLRARLLQHSDAEDLTQEVFLRFYLAQLSNAEIEGFRHGLLGDPTCASFAGPHPSPGRSAAQAEWFQPPALK